MKARWQTEVYFFSPKHSCTTVLHISTPLVLPGGPGWPGWPGGPGIYALEASTFSPVICLLRSAALFGSKATCQEKKSM